jgi:hypothetical protein
MVRMIVLSVLACRLLMRMWLSLFLFNMNKRNDGPSAYACDGDWTAVAFLDNPPFSRGIEVYGCGLNSLDRRAFEAIVEAFGLGGLMLRW